MHTSHYRRHAYPRVRKGIGVVLAGAVTVFATAAKAQSDSYEVLGIQLGSPADAVAGALKLEGAKTVPYKGTLSAGSFRSPELLFGEDMSDGARPGAIAYRGYEPDKEYVRVVLDLRQPQKIDYIKRVRIFSKDTNPSFDDLKASLIQKYGEPVSIDMNAGYPIFIWSRGSQIVYSKRNIASWTCVQSLIEMWPLAQGQYGGAMLQNKALPRCGSWLRAQLEPASYNPSLVSKITIDAGNLADLHASDAYIREILKSGAAGSAAGETKRAPKARL